MKVVLFFRKPYLNHHSIERVYYSLLPFLSKKLDVNICVMPFKSKGIIRRVLNGFYAWLKRGDVNHITGDINYVVLFLPKSSLVLTIHDIYPLTAYHGIKKKVIELFWFQLPINRVKKVVFISEFTQREVLSRYPLQANRYLVISNLISSEFLYQPKVEYNTAISVLQVGVKKNKNILVLAEALAGVKCKLVIVGSLSSVQRNALQHHRIDFDYYDSVTNKELNNLYVMSDLVLFVSTYEGFGLPIIEAQAVGRPVITSNVTSMPEVAGEGALLVNPYSVDEIQSAIKEITENKNLRDKLVRKGLANIKRFSPQKISKQYLDLYQSILNE